MPDDGFTTAARPGRGRPAVEHARVRDHLLRLIRSGTCPPGARLPPVLDLLASLGTTRTTVQAVFDGLVADGQIVTRGRHGTFVSADPPVLRRVALVFQSGAQPAGNRFLVALRAAADAPRSDGMAIVVFGGLLSRQDAASFTALVEQAGRGMFAGLIVVAPPAAIADTPLAGGGTPIAYVSKEATGGLFQVNIDRASFHTRAIDRLRALGCTQPAIIAGASLVAGAEACARWSALAAAAGLRLPDTALYGLDLAHPSLAARAVLQALAGADPPDGILVADDNLLPAVMAGLAEAGRHLPVVSLANLPLPADDRFRVVRIGFDTCRILDLACAAFRNGGPLPQAPVLVPAEDC